MVKISKEQMHQLILEAVQELQAELKLKKVLPKITLLKNLLAA